MRSRALSHSVQRQCAQCRARASAEARLGRFLSLSCHSLRLRCPVLPHPHTQAGDFMSFAFSSARRSPIRVDALGSHSLTISACHSQLVC